MNKNKTDEQSENDEQSETDEQTVLVNKNVAIQVLLTCLGVQIEKVVVEAAVQAFWLSGRLFLLKNEKVSLLFYSIKII